MEAICRLHPATASVLHETRAPASEATAAERGITHTRASWCVHAATVSVKLAGCTHEMKAPACEPQSDVGRHARGSNLQPARSDCKHAACCMRREHHRAKLQRRSAASRTHERADARNAAIVSVKLAGCTHETKAPTRKPQSDVERHARDSNPQPAPVTASVPSAA